jgi:serine/threonine protein kinase
MNKSTRQLPAGTLVGGRFSIVQTLGQGGMAHVYLAKDQLTGGQVAIKVMKDDLSNDQEFIKRFDTEAKAASSLDHPNIIKVMGYGQDGDLRFIVQEYVEGSTLKELINEKGPLPWQQAVPLAIQIGLALEHAHQRGVVHRDIKPQNILITRDMVAKVTDFGIARASNANTITLTSGVAFGSVHYFSPEQARGGIVGEKSDLYSLGILMYEMLTGRMPFDGETSVSVAIKHLQEMPPLPSTIQPGIPAGLDRIVNKCIQKSTEMRYNDARELVDELDAFMIDPTGVYGQLTGQADWEGNTTAIGLQPPESNFGKLRDIEKTISDRRRSRTRDTAIMITIIVLSIIFLGSIFAWGWSRIRTSITSPTAAEFVVANYIGKDVNDVIKILTNAGVKYEIKPKASDTVNKDIILDQNPGDGVSIRPGGTTIILYVSAGQELITITDYSGQTYAQANASLSQLGFSVTTTYEYSDFEKGIVIKTSPAAGQSLARGGSITLVVSEGNPSIIMPNLVGMSFAAAKAELAKYNLTLGPATSMSVDPVTGKPVDVPEAQRIIIKQSLAAGTDTRAMTVIGLTYGTQLDYDHFLNPTPIPSATPTPIPTTQPTDTTPSETTAPSDTTPSPTPSATTTAKHTNATTVAG